MVREVDADLLDDPEALDGADPGGMLRQVASSAAQVREAVLVTAEAGVAESLAGQRPRAVIVTGMGGSGVAGDVLAAVCGTSCPVPIVTVRSYRLPGWVGPTDLVIAVSCSGGTEETVATATEAVRRGCQLVCVGGTDSPLARVAEQGRAPFVPVRSAGQPRSTLWGLSLPPIMAARALGLVELPDAAIERTAALLEEISYRCRPASESFLNPGKQLALELGGTFPMIWGTSPLAGTAAYRLGSQLAENAKYPAAVGELPEANHNQVVTFDGPFAGPQRGSVEDDFFRDRVEEPAQVRLRLVMVRDSDEHPQVGRRREASVELAEERGVAVSRVGTEGTHPLERLASLVSVMDYASVYLALGLGIDPTPVTAIERLKERIVP